jgi:hypothetical protein
MVSREKDRMRLFVGPINRHKGIRQAAMISRAPSRRPQQSRVWKVMRVAVRMRNQEESLRGQDMELFL